MPDRASMLLSPGPWSSLTLDKVATNSRARVQLRDVSNTDRVMFSHAIELGHVEQLGTVRTDSRAARTASSVYCLGPDDVARRGLGETGSGLALISPCCRHRSKDCIPTYPPIPTWR